MLLDVSQNTRTQGGLAHAFPMDSGFKGNGVVSRVLNQAFILPKMIFIVCILTALDVIAEYLVATVGIGMRRLLYVVETKSMRSVVGEW